MLIYRELRNRINQMTEEQLEMNVVAYGLDEEYYPIYELEITKDNSVLDDNHPVLIETDGEVQ